MEDLVDRAKQLFYQYHGNRFYMNHDGVEQEYDSYHISKETEELWAKEFVSAFLESGLTGKKTVQAYSIVTDLLKIERDGNVFETCLYYPLRADHLDDVTRLFMLPLSFKMAEAAARKKQFSKQEAAAYIHELESYMKQVMDHVEKESLSRAEDYVLNEFSDPVYVADYLRDIKERWERIACKHSS